MWRYNTAAPSVTTEADVIFNNRQKYDSYRGPLQYAPGSNTRVYDLRRVALHEFGHVLGLDHPDEYGQAGVTALMNSQITDLDHLADDDIAGASARYAFRITSSPSPEAVPAGAEFRYTITTNRSDATFSATGLPAGLQLDPATGLISGTLTQAGTFDVTISAHVGSVTVSAPLRIIISPPGFTSAHAVTVIGGNPLQFQLTATNKPTSFAASGLPAGLQLASDTGVISGTASQIGQFIVQLSSAGEYGEARGTLTITVLAPTITSALRPRVGVGLPFEYQISATNRPTSFSASGLPRGLTLDKATGVITGTLRRTGTFNVLITAHNPAADASATISIVVPRPAFIGSLQFGGTVGSPLQHTVFVTAAAYVFGASNLPPGLRLETSTGVISGRPTISGEYQVPVTAQTDVGVISAVLRVIIMPAVEPNAVPAATWRDDPRDAPMIADPRRPRVYVLTWDGVKVIAVNNLSSRIIRFRGVMTGMSISPDGSTLWLSNMDEATIGRIDLDALTYSSVSRPLPGEPLYLVREGAGGLLYGVDRNGQVAQIDRETGAILTRFGPTSPAAQIEINADGTALYLADRYTIGRYDISTPSPRLVQQTDQHPVESRRILLDPSGEYLLLGDNRYSSLEFRRLNILPTSNLAGPLQPVTTQGGAFSMAFSADRALLYTARNLNDTVGVIDTISWRETRHIKVPPYAADLVCDSSGAYLFVRSLSQVRAYPLRLPPSVTPPHSLLNISTRLQVRPGEQRMIGGFIISGSTRKRVVVRALGPSINAAGTLADPALELFDSTGALVARNDNWNSTRQAILDSKVPPGDEHEAAVVARLAPGAYTAVVGGVNGTSGVALVEVYDLEQESASVANISTRGHVGTFDNVMIGGFILGGDQPTRIMLRAIGPSLSSSGVARPLADTTLDLHDGNGARIAQNDDWRSDQGAAIVATGIPPADDRESAIVRTLTPGNYTAIVRGKDNTTGVGLVEVYNLDAK